MITLLVLSASASSEPAEPVASHEGESSPSALADLDDGAQSHNTVEEDATPQTVERKATPKAQLTLQQKRIFVLGLAAQENK